MILRKTLQRVALAVFALVLLSALPAFAGGTPPPPVAAPAGCHVDASLFGDLAPQSPAAESVLPAWLDLGPQATPATIFHGHCHCSCSRIPDCNTSADCGGGACLGGITCC